MACVWKLPRNKSPYWIGRYTDSDGRRVNRSTKQTNRKTAQHVADTWEAAAKKARACELTQAASIKILSALMEATTGESLKADSISGYFSKWIAARTTVGRTTSTTKRYQGVVASFLRHLSPPRANASIASLSTVEIENWRNTELKAGKGATTADYGVKVIQAALNSARRKGFILSNPAEAVEKIGDGSESREPMTESDIVALLNVANDEWKGMILLGTWCGLRIADAASLTWDCLDLDRETLTILPSKTRNKNPEPLTIALHSSVVIHFRNLTRPIGNTPLFPSLHGRKPGSHGGLSNEFSRLVERAGIITPRGKEKRGVGRRMNRKTFHSLRHTMISRMANADVSADVRRAMAGHSSDTVHRKYVHLSLDAQRAALKKL